MVVTTVLTPHLVVVVQGLLGLLVILVSKGQAMGLVLHVMVALEAVKNLLTITTPTILVTVAVGLTSHAQVTLAAVELVALVVMAFKSVA